MLASYFHCASAVVGGGARDEEQLAVCGHDPSPFLGGAGITGASGRVRRRRRAARAVDVAGGRRGQEDHRLGDLGGGRRRVAARWSAQALDELRHFGGVLLGPDAAALTRTPLVPNSLAHALVSSSSAALLAP
jgi:hypothetical protein